MNTVCQCNHLHQPESRQHHSETTKPSTLTVSEAAKKFMHIYEMQEIEGNEAMYKAYLKVQSWGNKRRHIKQMIWQAKN
jgi:hypothetical protein